MAWGQLLRLPNLLTVPGDPLAGFLLARTVAGSDVEMSAVFPCVASSVFLYAAGLITNDLFDLDEDRHDRPERPIPSGGISQGSAAAAAILFFVLGIGSAFFAGKHCVFIAAILAVAVLVYNSLSKRVPVLGAINMGACRGLSVLVGVSAVGPVRAVSPPVVAALGIALYIAFVTAVAADETRCARVGAKRWLPFGALVLLFLLLYASMGSYLSPALSLRNREVFALAGLFACVRAWMAGAALVGEPEPERVMRSVGGLIRVLLPVQAAVASLGGRDGLIVSVMLIGFMPLSSMLARRFYSS